MPILITVYSPFPKKCLIASDLHYSKSKFIQKTELYTSTLAELHAKDKTLLTIFKAYKSFNNCHTVNSHNVNSYSVNSYSINSYSINSYSVNSYSTSRAEKFFPSDTTLEKSWKFLVFCSIHRIWGHSAFHFKNL